MKYTEIFCISQEWKSKIFIIFVNLQTNLINRTIFQQVSKKSVFSKFWRQIIVHFRVYVKYVLFLWSLRNCVFRGSCCKQRFLPPMSCCYLSLTQIQIYSMTMELDFSIGILWKVLHIYIYEYDACISWNMVEYIKWYQTKIWADGATLGLSNSVFGFVVRRLVRTKSLSESYLETWVSFMFEMGRCQGCICTSTQVNHLR